MTVAQLIERLKDLPLEAVVLMDSGDGLARVSDLEFVSDRGPGAPAEIILSPSMDE